MSALGDAVAARAQTEAPPLLEVRNLVQRFPLQSSRGKVSAVEGVSFLIAQGRTLGLVGESGSGKTTIAHAILRVIAPTAGEIRFDDHNIAEFQGAELKRFRREVQMVFQDPFSSLDPRMSVGQIIREPLDIHGVGTRAGRRQRVAELLRLVSMRPDFVERSPQQLSGGQRQRVAIARALALQPRLLVCDEPVSALDVSVQAQILNTLRDLQRGFHLTCLFVSHDLAVVRFVADEIAVMYLGKIVEIGRKIDVLTNSRHPYTRALLSAAPAGRTERRRTRIVLTGEIPSAINPPSGCRFHTRCPMAQTICRQEQPPLVRFGHHHWAACHFGDQVPERFNEAGSDGGVPQ